jgi:large conductance mechanosensitive channel
LGYAAGGRGEIRPGSEQSQSTFRSCGIETCSGFFIWRMSLSANRHPLRRDMRWEASMWQEFKKFAMRGSVVDLAVGVIIGAAFGAIVNSLVADIITPSIGAITGGLDFSNHFIPLSSKVTAATLDEARKQGAVIAWGHFVTLVINFLIVAWALFLVIRGINRLYAPADASAAPPKDIQLLSEIRDLLAVKQ